MTRRSLGVVLGALVCALVFPATTYAQAAKGEHAFKGVVQKVDEKAKSMTVDGENVPGWMMAMAMVYSARQGRGPEDREGRRPDHGDGEGRRLQDAVQRQGGPEGAEEVISDGLPAA